MTAGQTAEPRKGAHRPARAAVRALAATSDTGPNAVSTVIADLSTAPGNSISLPAAPAVGPRFYRLRTP